MNDKPLTKCPKCGKTGIKRLIGRGAGLIFKGSGFYITDYKNKGAGKPESGSKPPESKPSESKPTESKPSESKPVATPPASKPSPPKN